MPESITEYRIVRGDGKATVYHRERDLQQTLANLRYMRANGKMPPYSLESRTVIVDTSDWSPCPETREEAA